MLSEKVREFASQNHKAVLTTFRRNGAAQMSVVVCAPYRDGVAITTEEKRAKLANLRRDPRCTLLVSKDDWWGYVVLEGHAELLSPENTDPDELRLALRDVYRAVSGADHPDWREYDQAMRDQQRSVIVVVPERVYGTAA